jgi:biotin carboxyl carrier protein
MTQNTGEFSLRDAMEVLRLLDDRPDTTFDIRRHGFRLQCLSGTAPSPTVTKQTGDITREEPQRPTILKAPATGRFYGDAAVFSRGKRQVRVKAGAVVGRIEAGARAVVVKVSVNGTVAHTCVAPDGFVEYGQTLLVIHDA